MLQKLSRQATVATLQNAILPAAASSPQPASIYNSGTCGPQLVKVLKLNFRAQSQAPTRPMRLLWYLPAGVGAWVSLPIRGVMSPPPAISNKGQQQQHLHRPRCHFCALSEPAAPEAEQPPQQQPAKFSGSFEISLPKPIGLYLEEIVSTAAIREEL